jgi:hypothetical protein
MDATEHRLWNYARLRGQPAFYRLVIAVVLSSIVYAIVDMEYPRFGAFNLLKDADSLMVYLRRSIR